MKQEVKMKTSSKLVCALAGLAVLCVCAATAAPLAMSNGTGCGMMKDGNGIQSAIQQMQANGVETTELEARPCER